MLLPALKPLEPAILAGAQLFFTRTTPRLHPELILCPAGDVSEKPSGSSRQDPLPQFTKCFRTHTL